MVWGEIPSPIGTYTGRERVRFPPFENCFEENSGINIDKTVSITNLKSSKCPVKRESKKGLKCCCCPVTETFKRILSKKRQTKYQENMIISKEHIGPDLIFVIFYTTAFWGQEISHLKEQFFCVPIGNLHLADLFTQPAVLVVLTNMRGVSGISILIFRLQADHCLLLGSLGPSTVTWEHA